MAVIVTTSLTVPGRTVTLAYGIVIGEGATAVHAYAQVEEMALAMEADAVIDFRLEMQATADSVWFCAYGTAVALAEA